MNSIKTTRHIVLPILPNLGMIALIIQSKLLAIRKHKTYSHMTNLTITSIITNCRIYRNSTNKQNLF